MIPCSHVAASAARSRRDHCLLWTRLATPAAGRWRVVHLHAPLWHVIHPLLDSLMQLDVPDGNVQRQVWRGGSREGSGRDASVLLMLQRDCMVSMPAIRASQPSPTRALVHSQQVALTRARDAAAELELSCGPSTTQLEAAEHQARWACHVARQEMQEKSMPPGGGIYRTPLSCDGSRPADRGGVEPPDYATDQVPQQATRHSSPRRMPALDRRQNI